MPGFAESIGCNLASRIVTEFRRRFYFLVDSTKPALGRFRTISDVCGAFRTVFERFRTISHCFRTVSDRFGPLQTFLGPFSTRFRTVLDRFGRTWCAFGPFSDDSTPNLKISNFNWPRLGPVRAVPSVRAVPPSRGQLKFEILRKIGKNETKTAEKRTNENEKIGKVLDW